MNRKVDPSKKTVDHKRAKRFVDSVEEDNLIPPPKKEYEKILKDMPNKSKS